MIRFESGWRPGKVHQLELRPAGFDDYVEVYVDGISIIEPLIVQQSRAKATYVFDDTGLSWSEVDREPGWDGSVFDAVVRVEGDHGVRLLTMCGCGCVGCGDTWASVRTERGLVRFESFRSAHAQFPLSCPPTFDARQFADEVDRMHAWFKQRFPCTD